MKKKFHILLLGSSRSSVCRVQQGVEHIRLPRVKTADTSGIQDYHWNDLAICEECFEAQSFQSFCPEKPTQGVGSLSTALTTLAFHPPLSVGEG